jgi:hypothetical protein
LQNVRTPIAGSAHANSGDIAFQELSKSLESARGKLYAVKCDVGNETDVKTTFKWFKDNLGGVDILVNNAGVAYDASLIGKSPHQLFALIMVWACLFLEYSSPPPPPPLLLLFPLHVVLHNLAEPYSRSFRVSQSVTVDFDAVLLSILVLTILFYMTK